ncbi:MAG: hypothetical protein V4719_24185 [Planctomycetota bacterium]
MHFNRVLPAFVLLSSWAVAGFAETAATDIIAAPRPDLVQTRVRDWLQARNVTDAVKVAAVEELWKANAGSTLPAEVVLERVIQSFAAVHPPTAEFLPSLVLPAGGLMTPDARSLLNSKELGAFYQSNFRLYVGKYLVHREMYEEALETLSGATLADCVDPAGLLFYKATCQKALGLRMDGLATLDQLLKRTEGVAPRYHSVATLMQYDLGALEEKSLDDVSNKMSDVTRRLNLARAGEKTQKVEKEIVDILDELIKKMEDQSNGGGGAGSGQGKAGKGNQSGNAAQDSRVKGSTAPGEVDKKKTKAGGNWGNLADKERAKVKNLISRDFPAHYRQTIEEYFKKLATRDSK